MRSLASKLKMPAVSGYVMGGVILGGSFFAYIPGADRFVLELLYTENVQESLNFLTHIALGTISLTIGAELTLSRIKKLGFSVISIALFESFGAFAVVFLSIWLFSGNGILAFLLASISSATAPAATVAVIQQYKSRGPLTNTILAVVGFDDAISFMMFAFAVTVGKTILGGDHFSLVHSITAPSVEIALSLGIGVSIGFVAALFLSRAHDMEGFLFLLIAFILLTVGVAEHYDLSELLACMACGATLVNTYPNLIPRIRSSFSSLLPLLYAIFFIIGGSHLDIASLPVLWALTLVYFIARSFGKIAGAAFGGFVSKAPAGITRLIGFTLLPQVGAAIALALVVKQEFGNGSYGELGNTLADYTINILLLSTLLTEIIGPFLTKMSLIKAGEAKD